MNHLLQVKMPFNNENNASGGGPRNLKANDETTIDKVEALSEDLRAILRFYEKSKIIENIIIDVNYNDIIPKTKRIQELLKPERHSPNETVVGARFSSDIEGEENHIITYYVDRKTIYNTLRNLELIKKIIEEKFSGKATAKNFNKPESRVKYSGYEITETKIRNLIVDCSVVKSFSIPEVDENIDKESILITFYKTELKLNNLLEKLNISNYEYISYGDNTISVSKDVYNRIKSNVPYLISMISSDLSKIAYKTLEEKKCITNIEIPEPKNEPIIGVIDTFFDENVYFNKWVENHDYLDDIEKLSNSNPIRDHGTEVTSIIVDGPRLNPWLDDGCGRFRVRHFGVCENKISTVRLIKKIKEIVAANQDIHVWNLSLGTDDEISKNFISYDAAALDEIQYKYNVIFVVSGTNDNRSEKPDKIRIGSPADSLNSIVVNSVRRDGKPASYSRLGNVLSFFNKPDISYYGGDFNERIIVYSSYGEEEVYGTSFAAPWISRKLAYLIDVIGLQREVAKALIVDAAASWDYKTINYRTQEIIGYGIVPIKINKILESDSSEIRFILTGTSTSYKTVNYSIPIPKDENEQYPYIARAVLAYFPECSRAQGVDYTNRELSLKFGRVKNEKGEILDINENNQDQIGSHVDERQSRKEFRKWENLKVISKILRNNRPLQSYKDKFWGISLVSKDRLQTRINKGLNFAVVITLKEIKGVNRIQDFIKACSLRGWIVNELNVDNRIEIYNRNQEEIIFD